MGVMDRNVALQGLKYKSEWTANMGILLCYCHAIFVNGINVKFIILYSFYCANEIDKNKSNGPNG